MSELEHVPHSDSTLPLRPSQRVPVHQLSQVEVALGNTSKHATARRRAERVDVERSQYARLILWLSQAGSTHPSEHSQSDVRIQKVRTTCVLELSDRTAMVSIGFDAVADLSGLRFAFKGVRPGVVHPVTRAAAARAELYMLQDAPGGLFVILDGAPMDGWAACLQRSTFSW